MRGRPVARRHAAVRRGIPRPAADAGAGAGDGPTPPPPPTAAHVNSLQSSLLRAVQDQDYAAAAIARDALAAAVGGAHPPAPADWGALGVPPWLADRAARLGFPFPTDVQRRAVPAILQGGSDVVIVSQTGSGKTLAFLVPLLAATLPADPAGWTPPSDGPRAIVIVPTRDLGVQVALLAYRLLGGSMNRGQPGAADNMFAYSGPKSARVRGVLDESEALRARAGGEDLASAALVVGLPHLLTAAVEEGGRALGAGACVIAVDEADSVLSTHGPALASFLSACEAGAALDGRPRPDVVLVGASAASAAGTGAEEGWVWAEPTIVLGGGLDEAVAAPAATTSAPAALPPVPAGVAHRVVVVPRQEDELPCLTRLLRGAAAAAGADAPPPRTVVFAATPTAAASAADALRSSLWSVHRVSLLLPEGREPVRAVAAFRDGDASLLVATPPAARGLDLPCVDAVACLGPPTDAADYLHRAGRAGRLGPAAGGGSCTWVVAEGAEVDKLRAAAAALGVALETVDPPPPAAELAAGGDAEANEAVRRGLEDIFWTREAEEEGEGGNGAREE